MSGGNTQKFCKKNILCFMENYISSTKHDTSPLKTPSSQVDTNCTKLSKHQTCSSLVPCRWAGSVAQVTTKDIQNTWNVPHHHSTTNTDNNDIFMSLAV